MIRQGVVLGVFSALAIAPIAGAASVDISSTALGGLRLESYLIDGAFDGGGASFTNAGLNMLHQALAADGVSTDGVISIMLAETEHGLSLMSLVDRATSGPGSKHDSTVTLLTGVRSSGPAYMQNLGSAMNYHTGPGDQQVAVGKMFWDAAGGGDAIGWSGLGAGDEGVFEFTKLLGPGVEPTQSVQFLSWNGEGWEVAAIGEFVADMFGFSFAVSVVPLPPALLAGLGGLAFVAARRRR